MTATQILGGISGAVALLLCACEIDTGRRGPVTTETRDIDLGNAEKARVELDMNVGELRVSGGASKLMEGNFRYVDPYKPEIRYEPSSLRANIIIQQTSHGARSTRGDTYKWDLRLNDSVPMEMVINFGVGQAQLDLGSLNLRSLDVHMGVGQVRLDLRGTPKQDYDVNIRGGVGEATVYLPSDAGIIAKASGGIGGIKVRGLEKRDGNYVNQAYGTAKTTIHLDIAGGVGAINIIAD